MTSSSERNTLTGRQPEATSSGFVRVEVEAPKSDAELIRDLADRLRSDPQKAGLIRASVRTALVDTHTETAFDVFGSDLPDETFDGVFDAARDRRWREAAV